MHNMKRRMKQQAAVAKVEDADKEGSMDEEAQRRVKEVNAKKAETARLRYHRMVKFLFDYLIVFINFSQLKRRSSTISAVPKLFDVGEWRKKRCWQCQSGASMERLWIGHSKL